jgi:GAF domain-containing protein
MPEDDIAGALDEAAREGFLYSSTTAAGSALRFAHDRVQQAALALGDERERRAIELAAGRRLRARAGASPRDEDLFTAVELLNAAAALIDDPAERASLAEDDLMAGQRARTRAAFAAARRYFEAGVRMLDEALWERERAMAFALCAELCECEVSIGEPLAAEARLAELERRAPDPLERVRLAAVRIEIFVRDGKNAEAAAVGCEALRAVGIDLPAAEDLRKAALDRAMATDTADLDARAPSSRLDAPEMTDPQALASERLLMAMALPAYFSSHSLYGLVTSALVDLFARHGHSDISAMGYAHYGAFFMGLEGRSADAYAFGKLAVALVEKRKNHALACRVVETVGGNIAFLHEPLREVLARFPGALRAGIEAGDLLHANYVCGHIVPMRIAIGDDLSEVEAQMGELVAIVDRSGDVFGMAVMRVLWRTLWDLLGRPEDRRPLEGNFGEAVIDDLASKDDFSTLAGFRRTQRLLVHVVNGAWGEALAEAEAAEAKGPYAPGQFFATELAFFAALARLRTAPRGPLPVHRDNLRTWANLCPATYRAKHLLVEAEAMRVRGEEFEAMRLYDEAIAAAQENDMVRDEAIANELCAEFHAAHGRAKVARSYSTDALSAYRRWGAAGKVRVIEGRLSGRMGARPEGPPLGDITATASANASALLDATAAIRAAQAIATEVVLSRVVEQLLRILAAAAGAERAIMLVDREDGLRVAGRLGPGGIEAGSREPLDAAQDLAASVVRHVARSGEPVVLSDAARADYFAADPYVLRSRPRSLLCMAVAHAGRRAGIVYLENNAARGAFARDRLEPLGVLVAQAAIAMENAQLYEQLETTTAELRRANAQLEGDVAQRTAELRRELVAREQAERARADLAEEIIRVQKERLAELSAPLLPIAEGVVLVPLIGTMDAARAEEVLQTALRGASAFGARAVILDVTGMKGAGAGIAEALVTTARALALLGAEAVITGIRPDVARALVDGEAELGGLTTRSTLQSGMAYALRRAGSRAR